METRRKCSQYSGCGVVSAILVGAIHGEHLVRIAIIECGSVADCCLGRTRQTVRGRCLGMARSVELHGSFRHDRELLSAALKSSRNRLLHTTHEEQSSRPPRI
jgi:hypothetical protein